MTIEDGSKKKSKAAGGPTPEELAAAQAFGGGTSGPGKVWMPARARVTPQGGKLLSPWVSATDAANQYFNWTQKQRDDFRAKGLLSGMLTQGAGDLEAYSLWENLVKQSALYGAQGKEVGPLDILTGYVKGNSKGGWVKSGDFEINPATGEKRYVGPKFKTTTQTSTDLTDPATARAIATAVFQDLLGRDPGQGEISAYASALAASERANPSTMTTTTQYDETTGDAVGSSSTTSGGMTAQGRQQLAADAIKQNPEYGAVQAATTYMDALLGAVGGS